MDWEEEPQYAAGRSPAIPQSNRRRVLRQGRYYQPANEQQGRTRSHSSSAHSTPVRSGTRHPRRSSGSETTFHDATEGPSSGEKRHRNSRNSPRTRQQLNDRTVIEDSQEIQDSFEDPDVNIVETASTDDENHSEYRSYGIFYDQTYD